jgi:hypothetical protein
MVPSVSFNYVNDPSQIPPLWQVTKITARKYLGEGD